MAQIASPVSLKKVDPEKFVAIAQKLGLLVERQPSQWKVTDPTNVNRKFYIPGQKAIHKIELSGWSHERAVEWSSVFPGKKSPSPKITHILNFAQDEKLILRDFYIIAKSLLPVAQEPEVKEEPASTPASMAEVEETQSQEAVAS